MWSQRSKRPCFHLSTAEEDSRAADAQLRFQLVDNRQQFSLWYFVLVVLVVRRSRNTQEAALLDPAREADVRVPPSVFPT